MSSKPFTQPSIFDKLEFRPEPPNYKGDVPWKIQLHIATTNGINYKTKIGRLKSIPNYTIPIPIGDDNSILLDIGSGWGRWMDAAHNKGHIPIGVDMRHEFCLTSLEYLQSKGKKGYAVVGDLEDLPFIAESFDAVWSFSVLQHVHKLKLVKCLTKINEILIPQGFVKIQLPSSDGIRNKKVHLAVESLSKDDVASFCVRYYSLEEYERMFLDIFGNEQHEIHSFFGLGVLPEDLKILSGKEWLKSAISLFATTISKTTGVMLDYADSYYFMTNNSKLHKEIINDSKIRFLHNHHQEKFDNLNIINLLECPITQTKLSLSADRSKCISADSKVSYPVVDEIPIVVKSEAIFN